MNGASAPVQSATRPPARPLPSSLLPDEVVTRSLVRDVVLPSADPRRPAASPGVLALVTLDNGRDHTRPTTLGPAGLAGLDEVFSNLTRRAAAGEIVAVGVTGKPFFFCAGADLSMAASGAAAPGSGAGAGADPESARATAVQIGRYGHEVLRRLGELGVPSFAFVNGLALGGGLELALHASYRTVSAAAPAVGLPECFLGILPGWGGTYLLPNLVGPATALEVIVDGPMHNNRTLTGPQAMAKHLADAMFEPADFLACSLRWAAEVLAGRVRVQRPDVPRDEAVWEAAAATAREAADAKVHGAAPAPYRAVELVERARTAGRDEAFEAESHGLADLILSPQFRSSLYAFDLVNKRAKRPVGAPDPALARPVTSVGVVGAGLMAGQLTLLFVRRLKVPVVMTDLDAERVQRGVAAVHGQIAALRDKGRLTRDAANRLTALVTGSTSTDAFADADLVIEAVFEELEVKKQVFAEVEAAVSPDCVLMTNTSSLSITQMAAGLNHPERVVGFHFFNPVAVLPLVEVVRGRRTDDATLATAFAVGVQLRKSCVLVQDAPAFVVNRLLTRLMSEVLGAVDEGTPVEVADAALEPLGLPMSPFTLLQLVGPPVARHVARILQEAFGDRFAVSRTLERIVEAGRPGVYSWGPDGRPFVDEETRALLGPDQVGPGAGPGAEQVRERALTALAQECRLMLAEGVVAAAADIDLCLLLGAGWPFHLGGITPYLERSGHPVGG